MTQQVILVRHGESEFTVRHVTNGDFTRQGGLTDRGREQAQNLARLLAAEPVNLCVTSQFARVHETAGIALGGRSVPRLELPELNDLRFGAFEGEPLVDYRAWAREHGMFEPLPGGGESHAEAVERFCRGFRTVLSRPEETVLVVTHGFPICYVMRALQGEDPAPGVPQPDYATPYPFRATDLAEAVARLENWAKDKVGQR